MANVSSRLVVKKHAPGRVWLLGVAAVASVVVGGYLLFEYGRLEGGYDRRSASAERRESRQRIGELEQHNKQLREQVATLETAREVDREAYRQVEQNLMALQERIQQQREDLAFYQGIVSPEDGVAGLRIQRFEVEPGMERGAYRVQLVLVQAMKHDRIVSGVVNVAIDGSRDGQRASYALNELRPPQTEEQGQIKFSFRYFQDFERELVLPEGFAPERVTVEVLPDRSGRVLRESYDWRPTVRNS